MGIIETAKDVARLVQQLDNVELVKAVLNLQRECYDLVFENRELREKLLKAEEALQLQAKLEYRNDCYWLGDGSQEEHGPLCATCWDTDRLTVRMHRLYDGYVECQRCKKKLKLNRDPFTRTRPSRGPLTF